MKKKKVLLAKLLILLLCIFIGIILYVRYYNTKPFIKDVKYSDKYNKDRSKDVTLFIKSYNSNPIYCKFIKGEEDSEYILVKNNKCTSSVIGGKYKIELMYNGDKEVIYDKEFNIDGIVDVTLENVSEYVTLGAKFNAGVKIDSIGEVDKKVTYDIDNKDVLKIDDNGNIEVVGLGKTKLTVTSSSGIKNSYDITSTNLLRLPTFDMNKDYVPCNGYSKEEVETLDKILESKVKKAGVGTRAAAVEVARFLPLEFPYLVPYFYENGRLTTNGVDGEGRYYHKGLYLGEEKEKQITNVYGGPASWGCPLTNTDSHRIMYETYPNGFDCSGYISWVLVNAGLDLGDIGSGITSAYDYTDVGNVQRNMYEILNNKTAKPGDLIGWDGHIAIIAAMNDENIYISESLTNGPEMYEFNYTDPNARLYGMYEYIIDMSSNYSGDGKLKNMW